MQVVEVLNEDPETQKVTRVQGSGLETVSDFVNWSYISDCAGDLFSEI
jgi:hypothetical protein